MNKKLIIPGVVLLAAVGGWWLMHYFSDKEVIKRRFKGIAVELAKEGEETPVTIALKMRPIKKILAPSCLVSVPERNFHETLAPDLVIRYLIMYRSRQANLRVALEDIRIDIPAKGRARVRVLAHVVANQGQPTFFDETHEVDFGLRKVDKNWQIRQATLPEDLVRH